MAIVTSTVTGRVLLPNDTAYTDGVLSFQLSETDVESEAVMPTGKLSVTLDGDDIPTGFALWRNTRGLRGTYYTVTMTATVNLELGGGQVLPTRKTFNLGTCQVGSSSTYTIGALLGSPVGDAADWARQVRYFETRAEFVTWASGKTPATGTIIHAGGYTYRYIGTGTAISDLAGWVPQGATYPEHFGDVDGTADEVQINLAQVYNNANGQGPVSLAGKTYTVAATVIIRDKTGYIGAGSSNTTIKLATGATATVVQTLNFATQTGTNIWLTSSGVLTGFSFSGLRVDGNKAAAVSTNGVQIYGKRFVIDDLIVNDVDGIGLWTEAASIGGQTDWADMPECSITNLYIKSCGSHGLEYRGPHDGWVDRVYVASCTGDGVRFVTDSSTYNGTADIGFIHTYSNARGLYTNTRITAGYIQPESNLGEGIVAEDSEFYCQHIRAYKNQRTHSATEAPAGNPVLQFASMAQVGSLYCRTDHGGTAIQITGTGTKISAAVIDGSNKNGVAIDVDANQVFVDARIYDFDGGTGTGVKMNTSSSRNGGNVKFTSRTCNTHFNNVNSGTANQVWGDIFTAGAEVPFAGVVPSTYNMHDIRSRGATVKATVAGGSATVLSGTSSVTVTHGLAWTPNAANIKLTANSSMSGLSPMWVSVIGATTFQINCVTAAGGTVAADKVIYWTASN